MLPKKRKLSNIRKLTNSSITKKIQKKKSKVVRKRKNSTPRKKNGGLGPELPKRGRTHTIRKQYGRKKIKLEKRSGKFCTLKYNDIKNIKTILFHKPIVSKIAFNITSPKDRLSFSLVNKIIYNSVQDIPFIGSEVLNNRRLLIEVYATSINSAGGVISVSIANVSRKFIFFDSYASDGNFVKMIQFCKFFKNQIQQICIERKVYNGKCQNFIEIGWLPLILKHVNTVNFPNLDILSFCYVSFKNTGYGSYGHFPITKVCFHECEFGDESPFIFPKKMDQIYYDCLSNMPVKLLSNIDVIEKGVGECKYNLTSVDSYNTFINFIQQSNVFEIEAQLTMNVLNFQTVFLHNRIYKFIELRIDNGKTVKTLTNLKHLLNLNLEYLEEFVLVFVRTPIIFSTEFVSTLCEVLKKAKNLKVLRFCGDYRQRIKFSEWDSEERIFSCISKSVSVLEISIGNWHTLKGMSYLANSLKNLELVILNSVICPSFNIPIIFEIFKHVRNFVISFVEKHSKETGYQWMVEFLNTSNIHNSVKNFDSLIIYISGEKFYHSFVDVIKNKDSNVCRQIDLSLLENGICEFTICWKNQNLRLVRRFTDTRCRHCCAGEQSKILTSFRKK